MQIDLTNIEDVLDWVTIPDGTYRCRVAEVRAGETREGRPRWGLRLEVADGEYAGRTAGWDSIAWTDRGMRRAKYVLEKLGFDVSAPLELAPSQLEGLEVVASFQLEERENPDTGQRTLRLRVPYLGYASVGEHEAAGDAESGADSRSP